MREGLAFLIIALIMAWMFRSGKMLFVCLIPNTIPLIITAGIMGYFADRGYGKSLIKCIIPLTVGTIVIFVFGIGYLSTIIGFEKALVAGLLPFIPSELFKIALAHFIIPSIRKYTKE